MNVTCKTIKHLENNISKRPMYKLKWDTESIKITEQQQT